MPNQAIDLTVDEELMEADFVYLEAPRCKRRGDPSGSLDHKHYLHLPKHSKSTWCSTFALYEVILGIMGYIIGRHMQTQCGLMNAQGWWRTRSSLGLLFSSVTRWEWLWWSPPSSLQFWFQDLALVTLCKGLQLNTTMERSSVITCTEGWLMV